MYSFACVKKVSAVQGLFAGDDALQTLDRANFFNPGRGVRVAVWQNLASEKASEASAVFCTIFCGG